MKMDHKGGNGNTNGSRAGDDTTIFTKSAEAAKLGDDVLRRSEIIVNDILREARAEAKNSLDKMGKEMAEEEEVA